MSIKRIICIIIAMAMLSFVFACGDTSGGSGGGNGGGAAQQPGGSGGNGGGAAQQPGGSGGSGGGDTQQPGGSGGNGGGDTQQPGGGDGSDGDGNTAPEPPAPPAPPAGGSGGSSNLAGSPIDVLGQLVDGLKDAGVEMPMTLPPTEVEAELSQNTIGLSEDDFNKLVKSAAYNLAAIGTFAHQIIVIQANDSRAAGEVKGLISGPNGYDPKKWVCVWPERVIVVDSGDYVLLVAARAPVVEASIDIFTEMAGTTGSVITSFEHEGEVEGEPGGGGFGGGFGGGPMPLG